MDLNQVIGQIKTYAPIFQNRVAGSAELAAVQSQTWMAYPAAYVIPDGSTASENPLGTGLQQQITERIKIVVVLDNTTQITTGDRRGQTAVTQVSDVETALWSAVLNWRYDASDYSQGFYYGGYEVADMDSARLFVEFTFMTVRTITEAVGFQPFYPPLTDIELGIDASVPPTGTPNINVSIAPL